MFQADKLWQFSTITYNFVSRPLERGLYYTYISRIKHDKFDAKFTVYQAT